MLSSACKGRDSLTLASLSTKCLMPSKIGPRLAPLSVFVITEWKQYLMRNEIVRCIVL